MNFNKVKFEVLHLGQGNLKPKYRLVRKWIESSPEEKALGVLVDEKLNMTWQCALTAQKDNCVLGCIKSSMTSRSREAILPLCSHKTPPGALHHAALEPKDMDLLEQVQRRATKMIKGLVYLCYENRLRE
ncbi:hypothetical protein BTVI_42895 [Pitangus sulphuratus]|nr:hypothetical protein BTVI_42895 [Pitangus sulphuratus]